MEKRILGRTGIEVTELCFGALPFGPMQKNLSLEEATKVVSAALKKGINFIDTAQGYKTYDPIREAIIETGIRPVIATKSPAASYEDMDKAVQEALNKMGLEYIDIFHLHAARADVHVFEIRSGAWQCLKDYKERGIIKSIGISTHSPKVVRLAAKREDVDIVFPIANKYGKGIYDGTLEEMIESINECAKENKGLYLMKVIGGGNFIDKYDECIEYARNIKGYASIALGMVSVLEVEYNVAYFSGITDPEKLPKVERSSKRYKVLHNVCVGCGNCISVCHSSAIEISRDGKAFIDIDKCVSCGYCTQQCLQFAIRIV